jgi:Zn-dependent peptidase ImmA (M78 family)
MSTVEGEKRYEEPRAHALRERYVATFGGAEFPVPVESIAEDLLGLRIERSAEIDCSGMLVPSERRIVLNAAEAPRDERPLRRHRFTVAHELGHWVCHVAGRPDPQPTYCRAVDLTESADRTLEREANVFAAELLMPEHAVRGAWASLVTDRHEEEEAVAVCAERFDVSPTAMRWRLYGFGMVQRPTAQVAEQVTGKGSYGNA